VLLLALLLFLVAYPALSGPLNSPLLAHALLTAVFLAGGWVVFAEHRLRIAGAVLGAPAIIGAWTNYALPDQPGPAVAVFFHLSAVTFHTFVFVVLFRAVHRAPVVSWDAIAAALCGYILVGVAFGHAFCLVNEVVPGSFGGLGAGKAETHFRLIYFSFITLTTVGYGDITPAQDTARALCVVEAVVGQFYLAVLVAELVGKRVAQALSSGSSAPE
jgi:hypothetical protein